MRLIDANALKEEMIWTSFWDQNDYGMVRNIIDRAPTVVPDDFMNPYKEGYERARKDFERPTGEWLNDKVVLFHLTCNRCGCNLRRNKTEVFEGDYEYNYCPNCGAKMKGEEE